MKINSLKKGESKGKKILKTVGKITLLSGLLIFTNSYVATASVGDDIANQGSDIGMEVWKVVKKGAMFLMAFFTVKDMLQTLNDGDHKDILRIFFKYAAAYAVIAFIIKFFKWIDKLSEM